MELDFIIVVRKGRTHVLANHMSRIPNGEALIGVDDDLPDAPLFLIDLVLEWPEESYHYMTNRLTINKPLDMARARRLIRDVAPYQFIIRQLYKQEKDGIICKPLVAYLI